MEEKKDTTVTISGQIADEIDTLINITGFWPSRTAFVREAAIAKINKEAADILARDKLKERF